MTKFEEEFDNNIELYHTIGDHKSLRCEVDQVKEVFKDWQPQQTLPVVKDFVAEWYEEHKDDLEFAIFNFCVELDELDEAYTELESWFDSISEKPIETLIRMKNGYTIEKPQLFYLKHIDMSKRHNGVDWYLVNDGELDHDFEYKGLFPSQDRYKFTQQEIDSMETGSYEQIEVKE